jgi:hypothetical protein
METGLAAFVGKVVCCVDIDLSQTVGQLPRFLTAQDFKKRSPQHRDWRHSVVGKMQLREQDTSSNSTPEGHIIHKDLDNFVALLDGGDVGEGLLQPAAKKPLAHRSSAVIQNTIYAV